MAKFPIQYTEATISGEIPAVKANLDVSTGGQELGREISKAGWSVFDLAVKYYNAQSETQFSQFTRQANERINQLALSFDTNLDPETYKAQYDKVVSEIHSFMPKNALAARKTQIWLDAKEPSWSYDVDKAKLNRADDNWLAELFQKQAQVGKTGIMGTLPSYIAEGVKSGRIDKSDAVRILAQTKKLAEAAEQSNMKQALYKKATSLGWDKGLEWLNNPENVKEYPGEIVDAVIEDVKTQQSIKERIDKELLEQVREKARDLIYDKINDGTITRDIIENSPLDQKEQQALWEKAQKEPIHKPEVYWPLRGEVAKIPDYASLDEKIKIGKKIEDAVGKGIDTADRTELLSLLKREDDPLKTPANQFYFDMVNELYAPTKEEIEDSKKKPEEFAEKVAKYERIHTELARYLSEPHTPKEKAEYFSKNIVEPAAKNRLVEWWDWWRKTWWKLPTFIAPEEERELSLTKGISGEPRPSEGQGEPKTQKEFEFEVFRLSQTDTTKAKEYYDKWVSKWQ